MGTELGEEFVVRPFKPLSVSPDVKAAHNIEP